MLADTGGTLIPRTALGIAESCYVGDVESAARRVVERSLEREGGYVCLCNVHVLVTALNDTAVHGALEDSWLRLPDGAPVAWLQRRSGNTSAQRIGGPDLLPCVIDLGRRVGVRHFLYGSTPDVTRGVERALAARYTGALFVGRHTPEFTQVATVTDDDIELLRGASPHLVWCALGAPKQEMWMREASRLLPNTLFLGVGAAFDFVAATKSRAPLWMRERGFEWLHRLSTEPRRLGIRYVRTNSEFLLRSGFELASRRLSA